MPETLLKPISRNKKKGDRSLILLSVLVIAAGIATGWFLSGNALGGRNSDVSPDSQTAPGATVNGETGLSDEETFSDSAEGTLREGGIEGEGTHHLEREGGPGKYVYLTSTVINLDSFVGKKVQVMGETISAKSAPWLMDVGRIKEVK